MSQQPLRIQLGAYGSMEIDPTKGLESFAWPGGYDIVYYTDDSTTLCADCATKQVRENLEPDAIVTPGYKVVGADILEGGAIDHGIVSCEECGKEIISLEDDEEECPECGAIHWKTEECQCEKQVN